MVLLNPALMQLYILSPELIIKLQLNCFKSLIAFDISFFNLFFNVIKPQNVKLSI